MSVRYPLRGPGGMLDRGRKDSRRASVVAHHKLDIRSTSLEMWTKATAVRSTASDLISRRGVFTRRFYGSVEQPETSDGRERCRRFRIENGESPGERDEMFGPPSTPVLENPEYQTRWYFKYFLGKLHQNYIGIDCEGEPFFLSIVLNEDTNTAVPLCRAILFKRTGAQKISLPINSSKVLTVKEVLSHFPDMGKIIRGPKEIFNVDIQKDLLLLEEQEGSVNFKFGVIYMKEGQTSDNEILSNENGSEVFDEFLELLGEKISLKGWDKFRGGLDNKGDMTGKHSVHTIHQGHEIMFHVSTLLPYSKENPQQVERKRHIGNDIVNIVFIDSEKRLEPEEAQTQFNPSYIKSQFTHIFAVVSLNADNNYQLLLYCDETVPLFGPSLPCPPVFADKHLFREFLLVKLINGEKATFESPTFARRRERTLDVLIKDLCMEHLPVQDPNPMLGRRAFSEVVVETPRHSRVKEDARQIEFVRMGQGLKLGAIVRGDAPTSLASSGTSGTVFRKSPWEASCFYPVFPPVNIICGDSWDDNRLILGTDEGVFIVEDATSHHLLFDKTLIAKQISVIESHDLLLLRGGHPNKDCKIYVFRLSQIDPLNNPKSRCEIKDHRLYRTKGTHLFDITRNNGSRLRMCVTIGKKLVMFQWKHAAAWTHWYPGNDLDTVDGFTFVWELVLAETPTIITILENSWSSSSPSSNDILVCVGYKNHWDIVNGKSGTIQRIHSVDNSKAQLVAAINLYEDSEIQLLLCYNHHNSQCHQFSGKKSPHFLKSGNSKQSERTIEGCNSYLNNKARNCASMSTVCCRVVSRGFTSTKTDRCHFQKLNEEDGSSSSYDFHWNSIPTYVVCCFPYLLAFTSTSLEIRLIINGNLVHSTTMPQLQLVSSKNDIYYATTSPEFFPNKQDKVVLDVLPHNLNKTSPPSSPSATSDIRPLRIYRIPMHSAGKSSKTKSPAPSTSSLNSVKRTDSARLAVPDQPRVSRSATSSPIPPVKSKLQNIKVPSACN